MDVGLHKRCRVIAPTYPGFGASQSNNGRTFLSFGEDVKELLEALQVSPPPHLLGRLTLLHILKIQHWLTLTHFETDQRVCPGGDVLRRPTLCGNRGSCPREGAGLVPPRTRSSSTPRLLRMDRPHQNPTPFLHTQLPHGKSGHSPSKSNSMV